MNNFVSKTNLQLLSLKRKYDRAYFNTENPLVSDEVYDLLCQEIGRRNILKPSVGFKPENISVHLPYYLGSLNKIKPDNSDKLNRWLEKISKSYYIIEPKLDGISCLFIKDKDCCSLFTRGNGTIGTNISWLIPGLRLPDVDSSLMAVRGELVIKRSVFDSKYSGVFSNPRNMVSGIVNSTKKRSVSETEEILKDIDFVAYEILNKNWLSPLDQLKCLQKFKFSVVDYNRLECSKINISALNSAMKIMRNSSVYDIDGIVIIADSPYDLCTKDNPSYALAFKPENEVFESKVVNVEWNISCNGLLKPKVEVEPIESKDVTIKFATGHNARFILDNGIGIGAVIQITRSGDVIPKIVGVSKVSEELVYPSVPYQWNSTGVEFISVARSNQQDVKYLSNFFDKIGAKFVSEATILKLYNKGYDSVIKIISITKESLLDIKGIEEKSADRILKSIKSALTNIKTSKLIGASGLFGVGIGERKIDSLLLSIPDILETTMSSHEMICMINGIEGFSDKTSSKISENLPKIREFLKDISPYIVKDICSESSIVTESEFMGKTFLFSGFRDEKLENILKNRGGKILNSVSKNLNYLIVKDSSTTSSKVDKAKKLSLNILTKEELLKIL